MRVNKKHRPLKKGYLPSWTEEVFVGTHARRRPVVTYRLSEWDGTPIKGTFYEPDVQKSLSVGRLLIRVEKMLKRKRGQVLVGWKGCSSKYDSWIPSQPKHGARQSHLAGRNTGRSPSTPAELHALAHHGPGDSEIHHPESRRPKKEQKIEEMGKIGESHQKTMGVRKCLSMGSLGSGEKEKNNVDAPRVIHPCARRRHPPPPPPKKKKDNKPKKPA